MSNPIDIIANAIRTADGGHSMGAGALAEVAAEALDDWLIVANAAEALAQFIEVMPDGARVIVADPHDVARAVLRSVAGGA